MSLNSKKTRSFKIIFREKNNMNKKRSPRKATSHNDHYMIIMGVEGRRLAVIDH